MDGSASSKIVWQNEELKAVDKNSFINVEGLPLFYVEYAGANSQILIGKGIVDKAGGTGFAGELTGDDSIDSNLANLSIEESVNLF